MFDHGCDGVAAGLLRLATANDSLSCCVIQVNDLPTDGRKIDSLGTVQNRSATVGRYFLAVDGSLFGNVSDLLRRTGIAARPRIERGLRIR